jgi:hypothetical protein
VDSVLNFSPLSGAGARGWTIGETVYALDGPRSLLEGRIGDLVQVHGVVVETERNIPLLEVTRVD